MLKTTQAGRHWGRHKTFLSYQSHLSVCIPGCLVVCLSVSFTIFIVPVSFCWSVSLLAYPSVCLFVVRWLYACVSVHLSVCLFICSSIDPSFICIFARLSFYSSVRPSVHPYYSILSTNLSSIHIRWRIKALRISTASDTRVLSEWLAASLAVTLLSPNAH